VREEFINLINKIYDEDTSLIDLLKYSELIKNSIDDKVMNYFSTAFTIYTSVKKEIEFDLKFNDNKRILDKVLT